MISITSGGVILTLTVSMLLISIVYMLYLNETKQLDRFGDKIPSVTVYTDLSIDRFSDTEKTVVAEGVFMNNVSLLLDNVAYPLVYKNQTVAYVSKCMKVVGTRAMFKVTVPEDSPRVSVPSQRPGYHCSRPALTAIKNGDLRLKAQPRLSYGETGRVITGVRSFQLVDSTES